MDYGAIGLTDTIAALDAAGVQHVGAGAEAADAHTAVIVTVRGLRVAFLGYVLTPDEIGGFSNPLLGCRGGHAGRGARRRRHHPG